MNKQEKGEKRGKFLDAKYPGRLVLHNIIKTKLRDSWLLLRVDEVAKSELRKQE